MNWARGMPKIDSGSFLVLPQLMGLGHGLLDLVWIASV